MKTAHKIIISVFSILLAASLVLAYLIASGTIKKAPGSAGKVENGSFVADDFAQLNPVSVQSRYPYMQSDIDSVFYSVDNDGNVSFFEYDGAKFTDYSGEVKTITVTPELTYNKIPIKISYIEKDGKTLGYGLFTNAGNNSVTLYSYIFAKLTDAPSVYGLKGKMLLLNIDPDEAYTNDKTYIEIFNVDMTNGGLTRVFSQRDRTTEKNGRFTDRWHILTDGYLKSTEKKAAVISGRLHNAGSEIYDIFDLNRSMNTPEVTEMFGTFLRENPKGNSYIYLKKTATGFKSVEYIGQEAEKRRFDGRIGKDFIFGGDWVYSVKDREFINIVTDKTITANNLEAIDMFAVNSDGTKFAAVANYKENQALFIIDKDGKVKGYSGKNIFNSNIKNICFADDGTIMTTATDSSGSCVNYLTKIQ